MFDVFYPQDVIRILAALTSSGRDRHPEYHAALLDVAIAFGVATAFDTRLSIVAPDWRVIEAETAEAPNVG